MNARPLVNRIDLAIILAVLILAVGGLVYSRITFAKGGDIICELYIDNILHSYVDLNENTEIIVPGRDIVLTVKNGAIAFTRSDCTDKICIKSGYLSHPGQIAVCLPNRVNIKIISVKTDTDTPDIIAW